MLILPIKKKWFDMILSGEKKEEYREIKQYYIARFKNETASEWWCNFDGAIKIYPQKIEILFRNRYSSSSPSFKAVCELTAGTGKEEWGAEKDKEYFVLKIKKIDKEI